MSLRRALLDPARRGETIAPLSEVQVSRRTLRRDAEVADVMDRDAVLLELPGDQDALVARA
jgi:hypothetical protein